MIHRAATADKNGRYEREQTCRWLGPPCRLFVFLCLRAPPPKPRNLSQQHHSRARPQVRKASPGGLAASRGRDPAIPFLTAWPPRKGNLRGGQAARRGLVALLNADAARRGRTLSGCCDSARRPSGLARPGGLTQRQRRQERPHAHSMMRLLFGPCANVH